MKNVILKEVMRRLNEHVVWGYPDGTILGVPVPRTAKGMVILGMLAS